MTIKDLKERIEDLPDHMSVFTLSEDEEFEFKPVDRTEVTTVHFKEFPDGKSLAEEEVFLIRSL